MASTLKVKIEENIILDNQDYGSKRVLEVGSIASIVKRIVNIGTNEIGLLGFGTAYNTELSKSYLAGQFDEDNVRYIRITNLDGTNHIALVLKNENNDEFGKDNETKIDKSEDTIPNNNSGPSDLPEQPEELTEGNVPLLNF